MNEIIYNDKLNLLRINILGIFSANELFKLNDNIRNNTFNKRYFRTLFDFRKAIINLKANIVVKNLNVISDSQSNFIHLRIAILVDKPYDTAKLMLLYKEISNENYCLKFFSAESTALNWLNCINNEEYIIKQMHCVDVE